MGSWVRGFVGGVRGFVGGVRGFVGGVRGFVGRVRGFTGEVRGKGSCFVGPFAFGFVQVSLKSVSFLVSMMRSD